MGTSFQISILILSIAGAFFYALAEACLFTLGKWRGRRLAASKHASPELVRLLSQDSQETLSAVILGNSLLTSVYLTVGLWILFHGRFPVAVGSALLLGGALIAGEIIPKTLAIRGAERWMQFLAPTLKFTLPVLRALCRQATRIDQVILNRLIPSGIEPQGDINEEDYKELLDVAVRQRCLTQPEKEIILGIIRLDRMTARDVMRPRSQVLCLPGAYSENGRRLADEARKLKRSRLPIYEENPDTIVGVLESKKLLLNPDAPLDDVMEFAAFVPETMNLWDLFQSLRRQGRGLAVALDEFGETAGIITMSDILEEMVGDLEMEEEESDEVCKRIRPGVWLVSGSMLLEDFHELKPDFPYDNELEVETMNGLMIYQLELVPKVGQTIRHGNYRLKASEVDARRVLEIEIEKFPDSNLQTGGGAKSERELARESR